MTRRSGSKRGKRGGLAERAKADARIAAALHAAGHANLKAFLLARTIQDGRARTLLELAAELGVPGSAFISYHSKFIDEEAKAHG